MQASQALFHAPVSHPPLDIDMPFASVNVKCPFFPTIRKRLARQVMTSNLVSTMKE
jgi:hypothetical protein